MQPVGKHKYNVLSELNSNTCTCQYTCIIEKRTGLGHFVHVWFPVIHIFTLKNPEW